jgi:hypothetical protein
VVSIPLSFPGLVNSINAHVHVGIGARLFDIAFILEVGTTSFSSRYLRWHSISCWTVYSLL